MYRFFRILQRDTLNLFLNPMWVVLCLAFPFLFSAILGVLTEGVYGTFISSYDYYGVTMTFFCVMYAATFSANSFMEENIKQANLRIVYSPIRNWFIPLSKIIATSLFTGVFYTIAASALYLLFNVNFGGKLFLVVWLLLMALNFFCSSIGVLMCCIFRSEGVANQIISMITAVFGLLSGCFFPVASLGETMVAISRFSPTTGILETVLTVIFDQDTSGVIQALLIMGFLSLLTIGLCSLLFKGEDYV